MGRSTLIGVLLCLVSTGGFASDLSKATGWGPPEDSFEASPCRWLLSRILDFAEQAPDSIATDYREAIHRLEGLEKDMAWPIDLMAKSIIGDSLTDLRAIYPLTWSRVPGYQSSTAWQEAQRRYRDVGTLVRRNLVAMELNPHSLAYPILQTQLLGLRVNELRYEREYSNGSAMEKLFRGEQSSSIFLVGAQPEAMQAISETYIRQHGKADSAVVVMASQAGIIRHEPLRKMASAIRFSLHASESPLVNGVTLQFNTDHIWTWGSVNISSRWEDSVQDAIESALSYSDRENVHVHIPLDLVGNGPYIESSTQGSFLVSPQTLSYFHLYPTFLASSVIDEITEALRERRPAQAARVIRERLEGLALSLTKTHLGRMGSDNSYEDEIAVTALDPSNPYCMNYDFDLVRRDGKRVTIHFFSPNDAFTYAGNGMRATSPATMSLRRPFR